MQANEAYIKQIKWVGMNPFLGTAHHGEWGRGE